MKIVLGLIIFIGVVISSAALVYLAYKYGGISFVWGMVFGVIAIIFHYRSKHGYWPDL